MPGGSRMPPRAFVSAYISIISSLIVGSTTTHAPPRSSPLGGMYTKTGCLYLRRLSTMYAPNLRTSPNMSRVPPEKPRQLAKTMRGRFSAELKSATACAVLKAESGYQTCPAWARTDSREAGLAGSAGMRCSTSLVSTAITPIGTPPSLARPTTTDLPQSPRYSVKLPVSKKPDWKTPSGVVTPASMWRGSYGVDGTSKAMSRVMGSDDGAATTCSDARRGTYDSQRRIFSTPS
mmetsp:Transcript_30746/g.52577  ORF Transcript_30746/g.52577 Transcript_30746/m.52577 type:complete len:234 (-) Transcript_30746:5345-6046(-)